MSDEADDDWSGYESGPFCRHWGDPCDCEVACGECGHTCARHWGDDCDEDGCGCPGWKEKAADPSG